MSGFKVEFSVINQLATPAFHAAPLAQRPAAGQVGRVFIDTDNPSTGMYRDTGTAWVQIAETAASDVDTLQNVTDNGNTTTNNITVGASNVPIGTIDVRRNTPALNNASDYGVVSVNSPTITSGANFGQANINAVNGTQDLKFTGSATISNQAVAAAGMFTNTITNSATGTITVGQAGQIRTIAAVNIQSYYNTAGATTITHNAGIRIAPSLNSGAAAATVTNNYQILIQDSTAVAGTVSFTNRWGVYQEGTSDLNYFAGNLLIKSTTNNGNALQVSGNANITGNLGLGVTPSAWGSGYKAFEFGNSSTNVSALFSNGVNDFWSVSNAYFDGTTFKYIATGTATGYEQFNGSHKWYQVTSGSAGTNISFTQAMTLDASGNLGIGTTNPDRRLTIQSGQANATSTTYTGGLLIHDRASGTTPHLGAGVAYNGGNEHSWIQSNSSIGAQTLALNPAGGNVGIGTTNPTVELALYNSSTPRLHLQNSTSGITSSDGLQIALSGSDGYLWNWENGNVVFATNNSERMRITSGGELLINTTTDVGDFKLQVSGNAYVSGSVGINTTSVNSSALIEMTSTTQGILIPRMTTTQRDNISTPAIGLLIFNTTTNRLNIYDGAWIAVH